MEQDRNQTHVDRKRDPAEAIRDRLEARYLIDGEFIGAPLTARILGIGRSTVHEQVQMGRFVIPHRMVNRKPLFAVADIAAWIAGSRPPDGRERVSLTREETTSGQIPARGGGSSTISLRELSPAVHDAFYRTCAERGIDAEAALRHAAQSSAKGHTTRKTCNGKPRPDAAD